ncbi:DUF3325 family protein [Sphingomonas sp. 4RDLI-65]|uniref:hypothetical protein n=1 Tax=Sphingomonas sp. 4RDLI-65 TaxID=3111641 RepID=UPI003C14883A
MLEAALMCFVAWLLLAAASFKYRRDLGIANPATVRALRLIAALIMIVVLVCCGAPLTGERFVRFLGAASIGGVALVALLSFRPAQTMQPVRVALTALRARNRP